MKKVLKCMVVLFALASITGCASMRIHPNSETLDGYKVAAETMTPENSVVFVGFFSEIKEGYIEQINPAYPRDVQNVTSPIAIVSKPVKPGTTYCLKDINFVTLAQAANNTWIKGEIGKTNRFLIQVPKEPGVYYLGPHYMYEIYRYEIGKTNNPHKLPSNFMGGDPASIFKMENDALLIHYKGTCWEPYIRENIKKGFDGVKHNKYVSEDMIK